MNSDTRHRDDEVLATFLSRPHLERIAARAAARSESGAESGPEPGTGLAPERLEGAVLLVDLSGFSRLTEDYAARGPSGAEAMTSLVNRYFERTSRLIDKHGGSVMFFAGDAVAGLWPSEDDLGTAVRLAAACAVSIQADELPAADGGQEVRRYAAIGAGELAFTEVGGVGGEWHGLLVGPALEQLAPLLDAAGPGDTVLSARAREALAPATADAPEEITPGVYRIRCAPQIAVPSRTPIALPAEADMAGSIAEIVSIRLRDGNAGWLAEFRALTVGFISVPVESAPPIDGLATVHTAIRLIQTRLSSYEGFLHQVRMDDKGVCALIAFGLPPRTHEREAERAAECMLEIEEAFDAAGITSAMGLATGQVYCGICGSTLHREYTLLGSAMNLAARLMSAAPGGLLCDEPTARQLRLRVSASPAGKAEVKGWTEPVPMFRLARAAPASAPAYASGLLDRDAELEFLASAAAHLSGPEPGTTIAVVGEAGIGKSRLLGELVHRAGGGARRIVRADGDAIEHETPYYPWRQVLRQLLGRNGAHTREALRAQLQRDLVSASKLESWAPCVNDIVPLEIPESAVTEAMDGTARADATRQVVTHLVATATNEQPSILIFDDVHWWDSNSLGLARAIRRLPGTLMVVGTRPEQSSELTELLSGAGATRITLHGLGREAIEQLVCERTGARAAGPSLSEFVWTRAEGHPFYSEEIIWTLRDAGKLRIGADVVDVDPDADTAELPTSLPGLITSRLDRLPMSAQITAKAASVLGRTFTLPALAALRSEQDTSELRQTLALLCEQRLMADDGRRDAEEAYSFSHAITRDVAYATMVSEQRRPFHREAAKWIEWKHRSELEPHFERLAHHWEHAGESTEAVRWLERAGTRALSSFSNREAINHFARAVVLTTRDGLSVEPARRSDWELNLGQARSKLSDYGQAETHLRASLRLRGRGAAERPLARIASLLGAAGEQALRRWVPAAFSTATGARARELLAEAQAYKVMSETAVFRNDAVSLLSNVFHSVNAAEACAATSETLNGYGYLAVVLGMMGLHRTARRYADRAIELSARNTNLHDETYAWEVATVYAISVGNWSVVDDGGRRVEAGFAQLGDRMRWETGRCIQGYADLARGRFESAHAAFESACRSAGPDGAHQVRVWARAGQVACRIAEGTLPQCYLHELGRELDADPHPTEALLAAGMLAHGYLHIGDRDQAIQHADRAFEIMTTSTPMLYYLKWPIVGVIEVYFAELGERGPRSETGRAIRARIDTAARVLKRLSFMNPMARPSAAYAAGIAKLCRGKERAARKLFRRAAENAAARGMPHEQAGALRRAEACGSAPGKLAAQRPSCGPHSACSSPGC